MPTTSCLRDQLSRSPHPLSFCCPKLWRIRNILDFCCVGSDNSLLGFELDGFNFLLVKCVSFSFCLSNKADHLALRALASSKEMRPRWGTCQSLLASALMRMPHSCRPLTSCSRLDAPPYGNGGRWTIQINHCGHRTWVPSGLVSTFCNLGSLRSNTSWLSLCRCCCPDPTLTHPSNKHTKKTNNNIYDEVMSMLNSSKFRALVVLHCLSTHFFHGFAQ